MIERDLDIPFVADLALREKQIQQNYRPVIAVHKWFARRPGTLFRSLLLSEFAPRPLAQVFYQSNNLGSIRVADPFMGGGTPVMEANRVGCKVVGYDINPMAYWIVKQELATLDIPDYRAAADRLMRGLASEVGHLYQTRCLECGYKQAEVKYFLWVKTLDCVKCGKEFDLFPGYLVAADSRHPKNVLMCRKCGELTEVTNCDSPGRCQACKEPLSIVGPARSGRCPCPHCGIENSYATGRSEAPKHRMFAIEYHCPQCRTRHRGRYFKRPDAGDAAQFDAARLRLKETKLEFVPDDAIPRGDETDRLLRWGYRHYREMFNDRQLLGLELSCRAIERTPSGVVRDALRTNLSDLLRYQNMLCRYDTVALKSLDIFSVHGFPVGLVQCESNLLGVRDRQKGTCVGSGGWTNITDKYLRAKSYCDAPFEFRHQGLTKVKVMTPGEWIGTTRNGSRRAETRELKLHCGDAAKSCPAPASLDAVLTDPPYFGNVQYAELMDFCYVWLRRMVGFEAEGFACPSTRNQQELTGNATLGRNLTTFAEGLSAVFQRMAEGLKRGGPFVFTYHHNNLEAYLPIAVAVLDARLTCSASLHCPGEMGASIHISGTKSSIIDTVFVCRTTGHVPRAWIAETPEAVAELVAADIQQLRVGGVRATPGDARCIACGHLVRLAVWNLRKGWSKRKPTAVRLKIVSSWIEDFGGLSAVLRSLPSLSSTSESAEPMTARESNPNEEVWYAKVPF